MESFNHFKRVIFIPILCFAALLGGCAYFIPSAKQTRAEVKVEKTKEAIFTSEEQILNEGKGYVFATKYALDLNPETNKFTAVAKQMSTKALVAIGQPDLVDVLKMQAIVDGLLSTNKALVEEANFQLQKKDEKIIVLQEKIHNYEDILKKNEAKFIQVSRENSKLADTWKKITNGFWWIVWIFVIGFVLNILSQLLPPPYSNIASLVGIPVGIFIKCLRGIIPAASKYAGVVSEKVHQETQNTTEKLVLAINELKSKSPESYEKLKPILSDKTDAEARNKIIEVKKDYNLI